MDIELYGSILEFFMLALIAMLKEKENKSRENVLVQNSIRCLHGRLEPH